MKTIPALTLEDVKRVVAAAETKAAENGWQPTIAVVDRGGHLMYLQRDDGPFGPADVSIAKARCAARFRAPTKVWADFLAKGAQHFMTMPGMEALVEGGVPLFFDGECIGAIGVGGMLPEEDGMVAGAAAAVL